MNAENPKTGARVDTVADPAAERGPSGTGHDTACECDAPRCERDGCQDKPTPTDPPVAVPGPASVSPAEPREQERIEALERTLRIIETEVYGRPEPFCRRIAAEIVGVLGVAPQ